MYSRLISLLSCSKKNSGDPLLVETLEFKSTQTPYGYFTAGLPVNYKYKQTNADRDGDFSGMIYKTQEAEDSVAIAVAYGDSYVKNSDFDYIFGNHTDKEISSYVFESAITYKIEWLSITGKNAAIIPIPDGGGSGSIAEVYLYIDNPDTHKRIWMLATDYNQSKSLSTENQDIIKRIFKSIQLKS